MPQLPVIVFWKNRIRRGLCEFVYCIGSLHLDLRTRRKKCVHSWYSSLYVHISKVKTCCQSGWVRNFERDWLRGRKDHNGRKVILINRRRVSPVDSKRSGIIRQVKAWTIGWQWLFMLKFLPLSNKAPESMFTCSNARASIICHRIET